MAHYTSNITWKRDDQSFTKRRYSRRHTWLFDGGLSVPASSSPHVVPLPYSDPAAVDPEEAFVAALSSCHMLWFLDLAAQAGWVVDDYSDEAVGTMGRNAQGKEAMLRVTLHPLARFGEGRTPTAEQLDALHHRAHEACYLASSVRTEVLTEPVYEDVP